MGEIQHDKITRRKYMLQTAQKFNKRERRRLKRQGISVETGFDLKDIVPLTETFEYP